MPAITKSFQTTCPRCSGTGLWQNRTGYPCNGCAATGTAKVIVKPEFDGFAFYTASPKTGRATKARYEVPATLVDDVQRYTSGATVGGGAYRFPAGVSRAGSAVSVLGVISDGGLHVAFGDGGYVNTARTEGDEKVTVEITDPAVRALVSELQAQLTKEVTM